MRSSIGKIIRSIRVVRLENSRSEHFGRGLGNVTKSGVANQRPFSTRSSKHKITPNKTFNFHARAFATPQIQENQNATISTAEYHAFSDETMDTLLTSLETLVDEAANASYEVEYSSGVLTLKLGENGTYVINKQPPNKQIWLSSPKSGPKRYDYDTESGMWVYARDGQSLGKLLEGELSSAFDKEIRLGIEPEEASP